MEFGALEGFSVFCHHTMQRSIHYRRIPHPYTKCLDSQGALVWDLEQWCRSAMTTCQKRRGLLYTGTMESNVRYNYCGAPAHTRLGRGSREWAVGRPSHPRWNLVGPTYIDPKVGGGRGEST